MLHCRHVSSDTAGPRAFHRAEYPDVANDGWFYVRHEGQVRGRFRSLAQATKRYQEIKQTLDIAPLAPPPPVSVAEAWGRELEARSNKSLFWTDDDFARVDRKTRGRPKH
jgi:hypothetical protein